MAPLTVIDYIVAHELCHLRRATTRKRFGTRSTRSYQTTRERKEWLRQRGAHLAL